MNASTPPSWEIVIDPSLRSEPEIVLDDAQRGVVEVVATEGHGPLLLLAGPGTGKTTTLVEAVAARVAAGTDPARILTLTFSRKAATELRTRIGRRLGRTVSAPLAWTFHGFGFSLLAAGQVAEDRDRPLRLMSGPEQDVAVRELLQHDRSVGSVDWPDRLHQALPTRGFTDEVRSLLGRARSLGLGPSDLQQIAGDRQDWLASAQFLNEYLDVLDSRGVVDYAELVARAVAYAESIEGQAQLRSTYDLVVVDEYQDTDPAQERLLQAIAGSGRDLVVVGDPDQSIYGFRGADVNGIMSFTERFPRADGAPAQTLVLHTSRRCGTEILDASRLVAARLGGAGSRIVRHLRAHRDLASAPGQAAGSVAVRTFATPEFEALAIADLLRREHLQQGTPWHDMAVLVRSGVESIPGIQRSLAYAGVPIEVAGDEIPLGREPVLAPLLLALQVVDDPSTLTPGAVRELLLSPLVAADPADLRRLGRALRDHARQTGDHHGGPPSSDELLMQGLVDPTILSELPHRVTDPLSRLAGLLTAAQQVAEREGTAHDVLWSVWSGTRWPERLQHASFAGGPGGRSADRDLDSVVALFELAARSDHQANLRGLRTFLAEVRAQQIPGDTLAERSARPSGVRVLTAHRSKGLEWSVVVVAGVQAERWPDVRRRGSLLDVDRLGGGGALDPATSADLRRDERRLFYVAITRAKRRLVVTAVASAADDGLRPSPFLAELGVPVNPAEQLADRPLTLHGLTAELRSVVVDRTVSSSLRQAAAERLATLVEARVDDRALVPAADPDQWWGVRDLTESSQPVRPPDQPLKLSGSQIEKVVTCPLQWFLSREVQADTSRSMAAGFGGVVHALADGVANGEVDDDVEALVRVADSVWGQLQYPAAWESAAEYEQLRATLGRFVTWHRAERGRALAASEREFTATIDVQGREVLLRGRLDRIELDESGRVVVIDLKTGKNPPTQRKVDENLQLATYQRAVAESAIDGVSGEPGGAELVYLRVPPRSGAVGAKVQQQQPFPEAGEVLDNALRHAVSTIDGETFPATPGDGCKYCSFHQSCPAQQAGRQVVT